MRNNQNDISILVGGVSLAFRKLVLEMSPTDIEVER